MRQLKNHETHEKAFVCSNEAGARDYTIPLMLLCKGSIDITTTKALSGAGANNLTSTADNWESGSAPAVTADVRAP